jgi:elongin-A
MDVRLILPFVQNFTYLSMFTAAQPKTLFQKARTEASKIQKAVYNARMIPPTTRQDGRVKPAAPTDSKSPIVQPTSGGVNSAVTVRTVTVHRSSPSPNVTANSKHKPQSQPQGFSPSLDHKKGPSPPSLVSPSRISASESRLQKGPGNPKKDPMAALFMPKHRAHSQLPEPPTASTSISRPLFVTDKR